MGGSVRGADDGCGDVGPVPRTLSAPSCAAPQRMQNAAASGSTAPQRAQITGPFPSASSALGATQRKPMRAAERASTGSTFPRQGASASVAAVKGTIERDLTEARRVARRHASSEAEPGRARARKARDAQLVVELCANVIITYGLVYAVPTTWWKVALLLPWSLYSALSLDNVLHYLNHWPLFPRRWQNALVRALALPLLQPALEISIVHWEHHKYNDVEEDQSVFFARIVGRSKRRGSGVLRYALREVFGSLKGSLPWTALPPVLSRLARTRPAQHAEVRLCRWVVFAVPLALAALDPLNTLCFFVPLVVIAPLIASLLMNLTDHVPGTLTHPFRQATYAEPKAAFARLLSSINRHSAATHLTHHLFPKVHWTELPALQRELAPTYERHGAPRSMLLESSALVGNWWALVRLFLRVETECRAFLAAEATPRGEVARGETGHVAENVGAMARAHGATVDPVERGEWRAE